jgi:hypothetical protein
MLEDDIQKLAERKPDISLETLETDVWKGIEAKARMSRTINLVAAWQAAVVALVLVAGIAGGRFVAQAHVTETSPEFEAFSPGIGLAPSTRLMGVKL